MYEIEIFHFQIGIRCFLEEEIKVEGDCEEYSRIFINSFSNLIGAVSIFVSIKTNIFR